MASNGRAFLENKFKDSLQEISFNGLVRLAHSEQSTDFTIVCGERKWRVHRAMLIIHSPVLAAACAGSFKETTEGVLDMSKESEPVVDCMVQFLYYLRYDYAPQNPDEARDRAIIFDIKLAVLADKYDIAQLSKLAVGNAVMRIGWWKPLDGPVFAKIISRACKYSRVIPALEEAVRKRLSVEWTFTAEGKFKDNPNSPVKKALCKNPSLVLRMVALDLGKVNPVVEEGSARAVKWIIGPDSDESDGGAPISDDEGPFPII